MDRGSRVIVPLLLLLFGLAVALSGCGTGADTGKASSQPVATSSSPASSAAVDIDEHIIGAKSKTSEEKSAACEALRYARDANAGSIFDAKSIILANGWACVHVEQTGVPTDEAVGYGVYMRKVDTGNWEVAQTGNGLSQDDLPGAPLEIFK